MSSMPRFIPTTHFPFFTPYQKNTHHLVVVALLRSITMIEQKDDHGIGWNAECGLCVQVYRASTADFCSSPTLPSLLQSCNTTTSRLFPKHGNTRRCLQTQTRDKIGLGQVWSGLLRLGQAWSGLVRWWKVRSLQPAPSCVNSHQPQKWSVSVNKHCLAHCPSQC